MRVFKSRAAAGQLLAERFDPRECKDAVLVTIPNGGIPVALPLAERLHLPVHVCVATKILSPDDPRVGIGAVGLFTHHFNDDLLVVRDVSRADLAASTLAAFARVRHREHLYVTEASRRICLRFLVPEVKDRTVLLVDDGLATGYTALAAIGRFQHFSPCRIIVAAPVCSAYVSSALNQAAVPVDVVTLVEDPSTSFYVDEHYEDFRQLWDEEVLRVWNNQPPTRRAGVLTEALYAPAGLIEAH